ncbi:hypothetical protein [Bacillus sp. AFS017336]|uniref:hypothetical protein n=1 Tax=Bacillus sp. AFS017336 TaxID=2033489 RepID=UPI000BEF9076|nr:hypothetical protein [Bacillus sp. AFS017336]PEK98902.1 hypothetical protein CN601_24740 [Bacillus sp. AFS017336]
MPNIIESFLVDEISQQEFYDGIIDFITSYNIRCGEYECNTFVIKKMDHLNFIIYQEFVLQDGHRTIHNSITIFKDNLISKINEFASKKGFKIRDSY